MLCHEHSFGPDATIGDVAARERAIDEARTLSRDAKRAYEEAVQRRSASQAESNDLISRKNAWTGADVNRFTELVKADHANEQAVKDTQAAFEAADEAVDKSFTALMKAILHRYHEEQIWSDKVRCRQAVPLIMQIRSLSTYGSVFITALNALIFFLALVVIEPWRRRRIVDLLDRRVAERLAAAPATATSSSEITARLEDTEDTVRLLVATMEARSAGSPARAAAAAPPLSPYDAMLQPPSQQAIGYAAAGAAASALLFGLLAAFR